MGRKRGKKRVDGEEKGMEGNRGERKGWEGREMRHARELGKGKGK